MTTVLYVCYCIFLGINLHVILCHDFVLITRQPYYLIRFKNRLEIKYYKLYLNNNNNNLSSLLNTFWWFVVLEWHTRMLIFMLFEILEDERSVIWNCILMSRKDSFSSIGTNNSQSNQFHIDPTNLFEQKNWISFQLDSIQQNWFLSVF